VTTETTISTQARKAAAWFTTTTRGDETITVLKDDAPEWVSDLVFAAHGSDFLPDDWRYEKIGEALDFIADSDDPEDGYGEFADGAVDVYTHDRLAWLSSNLNRPAYCDEAVEELGSESSDIIERIGLGQYYEANEIYGLVLRALEETIEEETA
jgi:hypothetical protein